MRIVQMVVIASLCAGCAEPARSPVTVTVASVAEPITLDPAAASDSESMQVLMQVFEQLVRTDGASGVKPSLATSWSVSEDGKRWTFQLRRGVRFHDGTPFTADAVVFSLERQRDHKHPFHHPDSFIYWESAFRRVKSVRKVDRYTVQIALDRPFAPLLANLAMFPASIVSPAAMRRHGIAGFASTPIGTGPFKLKTWVKGRRLLLVRNDRYWGQKPKVDRLIYKHIPEAERRLVSLQSGRVDVAYGLPPSDRQIVKLHPALKLSRVRGHNVAYLAMNTERPPFDDVRVRRAVNHAINKRALVQFAYQGLAVEAISPVPPSMWSHNEQVKRYSYDPAKAKQLLDQCGFDYERRIRFYVMSTPRTYLPAPLLVARMVVRDLVQVGMAVDLVVRPFGEHLKAVQEGEHELCLGGWTADNILYMLLDSDNARRGAARNLAMFSNGELHTRLIRAQQLMDRSMRERFYREAQAIISREAPWVPLAHTDVVLAARTGIDNLLVHPSELVLYRDVVKR